MERSSIFLSVCTTLLWGLPALYVIVREIISLGRFISNWSLYDSPFSYIGVDLVFLLFAILVLAAIVCVWTGNRKLKLISSVFFFVLSLLLIPVSLVSTWYVSFMNGWMGEQVACSSLAVVFAFPLAGMLLSILSLIKYYREKNSPCG